MKYSDEHLLALRAAIRDMSADKTSRAKRNLLALSSRDSPYPLTLALLATIEEREHLADKALDHYDRAVSAQTQLVKELGEESSDLRGQAEIELARYRLGRARCAIEVGQVGEADRGLQDWDKAFARLASISVEDRIAMMAWYFQNRVTLFMIQGNFRGLASFLKNFLEKPIFAPYDALSQSAHRVLRGLQRGKMDGLDFSNMYGSWVEKNLADIAGPGTSLDDFVRKRRTVIDYAIEGDLPKKIRELSQEIIAQIERPAFSDAKLSSGDGDSALGAGNTGEPENDATITERERHFGHIIANKAALPEVVRSRLDRMEEQTRRMKEAADKTKRDVERLNDTVRDVRVILQEATMRSKELLGYVQKLAIRSIHEIGERSYEPRFSERFSFAWLRTQRWCLRFGVLVIGFAWLLKGAISFSIGQWIQPFTIAALAVAIGFSLVSARAAKLIDAWLKDRYRSHLRQLVLDIHGDMLTRLQALMQVHQSES